MKIVRTLACLSIVVAAALPVAADSFPPVTEEERALTSVPGEPNAPAVILFKKSEFLMMGYGTQGQVSSRLVVQERRKILTEQGKELAEVAIGHSNAVRLNGFRGQTVLPDGRVLPLGEDAKFQRKVSKRQKRQVTSVAFPGVEVGAILDYQYELRFDSFFYLEPWYLSDELPVLHAEIVFKIPGEVQAQAWSSDPYKVGIHTESHRTRTGTEVRVWADNLPSVPDEPFGPPFADLASMMMMVPTAYNNGVEMRPLLQSWASVCKLIDEFYYTNARRKDGDAGKKARALATAASTAGGPRQQAETVYRFVRDEVETVHESGVYLSEGSTVGRTLAQHRGDYAEKALLLQAMLNELRMNPRLVWAANRWSGQINPDVANPEVFDRLFVAVDLDGQRFYLDPSDRALAFGRIRSGYEGMPALIFDPKKPEMVVLPETPFDQNDRRAVLDLDLDAGGRIAGKGEMTFTGHHAWEKTDWQEDDAATVKAWTDWLAEEFKGFQIADVAYEEKPDDSTVRLTWSMKQREEEVLGDEASLTPSKPLGPTRQPFVQDASKRRSPVMFDFPDRDEVELRLRWPEGWQVETKPKPASSQGRAGALAVSVEVDEAGRALVYRRRLDFLQRQLGTLQLYEEARKLFDLTEKSDAETLVLVRR
ncbi:MAG TPA: DUF3857 domain-containing protein [Thermoanaerobaculia bacterium]|jgi:hypothetical protein|nr:DUF3857 domain-containing protein [Thermoanaerobaculia bacterium]